MYSLSEVLTATSASKYVRAHAWVSEYSWIVSTHCSVPTSYNTIESTLDSEYL